MKLAKSLKSVGALLLTVAMLAGMMSFIGTFTFATVAETEEVTKFTANFAELNNSGSFTGSASKLVIEYNDPATDTSATNVANHNWLSTRFDSYTNFHNIIQRGYFSQGDEDGGSRFVYGALNALGEMADAYRGLMFDNASPGGELFWSINTLVPHYDGEAVTVKNFEATVKFAMTNTMSGGLLFAFHESAAGQYTFADSYTARQNTGSVLAIGNSVDTKANYGASGTSTDAWKFYADGKVEANYMTNVDKNFGVNLKSQWYTLTVKAVNGTVTFTLVSEDGTVNETMTKAYSSTSGNVSLGVSGREVMLREVTLVELDSEGTPVDIGTYMVAGDSMKIEDFPAYEGGGKITAKDGRDGAKIYVVEDTSEDQYTTFLSSVEAAGWTKYTENDAGGNLFATYTLGNHSVHTYYLPNVNRVHVIDMPLGAALPAAEAADYTKVCEPLFTQVQLSYATASEGMSYLMRLSDGRFIVIDGGDDEADYLESKHLYSLMEEQNVLDKITVAAWIITHAHSDHESVPIEFLTYYTAEDLVVEQVLFNYPTTVADANRTGKLLAALDVWAASGTERVTPYIGQEFYYADAKIEFLHTIDAYGPGQIDGEDFNNTSSVFTIEIAGQKIMILGDMHTIGNDQLVKLYGSYLKSDISQWAHHGLGGATRELYVEIDPAVVLLPAGVFHHTNTYNYYRYHAPADERTGQSFKWLYYPESDETNHVKEVFLMGFKEVTLTLPYTSSPDCDYFANRNNNGYIFEEAATSAATVPNPFFELDLGDAKNIVYYKDEVYEVPSKRVEQNAAVETYTVSGLGDVLNGNSSFELFVAIDNLPNVLNGETFYMFGTSTMGLTLENNTLNVSLRKGNNTAVTTNGGRYYKGNVVGGGVVNHIVGTFDATSNTLAIYENGVLIYTTTYVDGFTAEDVLNLGSTGFNSQSGYTVLGARVYNEALTADQVAATYWAAIDTLPEPYNPTFTGWVQDGGKWYRYENGQMITNAWRKDSKGWVYLGANGAMLTNAWCKDSKGWCYVGADGYCVTNCWKKDSIGWIYLDANGSMTKSAWVYDGGKWYYCDANGYMVANKWMKDSKGWVYLGANGAMVTNKWVRDSVGWCYVGSDGYAVTNCWKKDSKGWCYLNSEGRMATNCWVRDSKGWCYVGADGYAVTNCWKKDSIGWIYLDANGSMTKSAWVQDGGKWYYLDANGYMVANTTITISGKKYTFNASGVWVG